MNESLQTNLATCDLFPVAMMSFTSCIVGATFEHLKFFPNPFQDKSFCSVLSEKENKKLKIEQLATYKCT